MSLRRWGEVAAFVGAMGLSNAKGNEHSRKSEVPPPVVSIEKTVQVLPENTVEPSPPKTPETVILAALQDEFQGQIAKGENIPEVNETVVGGGKVKRKKLPGTEVAEIAVARDTAIRLALDAKNKGGAAGVELKF